MNTKSRKRWTADEKLEVLNHYQKEGVSRTSRQFGVSSTMIYKWQRSFESEGTEGLSNAKQKDKELRLYQLERENRELKAIVAEKEMQLRIQEAVIKKNHLLKWKP